MQGEKQGRWPRKAAVVVNTIEVAVLHGQEHNGHCIVEPGSDKHWNPRVYLGSWEEALRWCVECRG